MMRIAGRPLLIVALAALWLPIVAPHAAAADGDLDSAFGTGGTVTTDFGGLGGDDLAYAMAIQADGKIVAGGYSNAGGDNDFALARYTTTGSLDSTFGSGGTVTTDFGASDLAWALAIQGDGKIVAAGFSNVGGTTDFALARYTTTGSLDPTFGTGGEVTTDLGAVDVAYAVAIQGDGKIVAAGYSTSGGTFDFALARYNANGTLDSTFGSGGKVITDLGGNDVGDALAIQGDGKIVAGGYSDAGGTYDFALARYNANGTLDSTFGSGGTVATDFGGTDSVAAVAIQGDGRIVAAGTSAGGSTDFALARYNANGTLDSSFGSSGKVTTDFGATDYANGLRIQADGKIVVAGSSSAGGSAFALARYNADGTLDSSFGTGGTVTTDFGGIDAGRAVAIQTDDKIVVAGYTNTSGNYDFALARYLSTVTSATMTAPTLKFQTGVTFSVKWAASAGTFYSFDVRVRHVAWNSSTYSAWSYIETGTVDDNTTFTGIPGNDYCFDVAPGGQTNFSPQKCTSVPLDDRALAATGSWTRGTGTGFYKNTFTSTKTHGNSLTKTGVHAHAFTVMVEKCPGCGSIQILFNGVLEKTVSLVASSALKKQLITVTFSVVKTGTVKVVDSGLSGKLVSIDGLGVSRV